MMTELMSRGAYRVVVGAEVDAPQSGAMLFAWPLQDGVAGSVADGNPKACEDGSALGIAESTNAEKVVGEGRHDMANMHQRW